MPGPIRNIRRGGGIFLFLVAAFCLGGSVPTETPEPAARSATTGPEAGRLQNVILISVDSLRADHLPLYGYPRETTPFLEQLMAGGRTSLFDRLTAVSSACHPSHTALLTGLYPQQVGVPFCGEDLIVKESDLAEPEDQQDLEQYQKRLKETPEPLVRKKTSAVTNWLRIPESAQTLTKFLSARGFQTAGFVSIWTLQGRFGYSPGFELYVDAMPQYYGPKGLAWLLRDMFRSQRRQEAGVTMAKALDFLDDQESDRPFFIFMNLANTHVPYVAPPDIHFESETAPIRAALQANWKERYSAETYSRAMKKMGQGTDHFLLDSYDRSILFTDSLLGRLFEHLQSLGLRDRTMVVITSDHGDSFGQHLTLGEEDEQKLFFEHSVYVWEETQHVPLIIFDPSGRIPPGRHSVNASQVDIVPTLLGALGYKVEDFGMGNLPGRDLAVIPDVSRRVFFLSFGRGRPGLLRATAVDYPSFIGFREGDTKFFLDRKQFRGRKGGRCFLYDLAADPHEKENLCPVQEDAIPAQRDRELIVEWYNRSVSGRKKSRPKEAPPSAIQSGRGNRSGSF